MIGYYVHHHGRGHLTRATEIARELRHPITGLSTLERPAGWPGDWLCLDDDASADATARDDLDRDATANGLLHWVPFAHTGLRSRMAAISGWIAEAKPSVFVSDVSVEVSLLARLHGVAVVTVAVPGERGDPAHALGFGISSAIIAAWPAHVDGVLREVDQRTTERLRAVGGISSHAPVDRAPRGRHAVVMMGAGGTDLTRADIDALRRDAPDWTFTVLSRELGEWVDDPWPLLLEASVVITHGGQGAISDVAACRRPAIVIPQDRPFREQHATASALSSGGWPAIVLDEFPRDGWSERLERCAVLDVTAWRRWADGLGAVRAAAELDRLADVGGAA